MNPTENSVASTFKPPAIGLIVVGSLNALMGLLWIIGLLVRLVGVTAGLPMGPVGTEGAAYRVGGYLAEVVYFFNLIASPFILIGAINMLKGKKYASAKLAAILAMIPAVRCCFLFGIPVGVWALIVLSKPEVKAFFESGGNAGNDFYSPPPPPQYQ